MGSWHKEAHRVRPHGKGHDKLLGVGVGVGVEREREQGGRLELEHGKALEQLGGKLEQEHGRVQGHGDAHEGVLSGVQRRMSTCRQPKLLRMTTSCKPPSLLVRIIRNSIYDSK